MKETYGIDNSCQSIGFFLLIKRMDPQGNEVSSKTETYTYDKVGNQLTQTDSTGITTRKYDEAGRVIEKTVPNFGKSYYTYDITLGVNPGNYAEETKDPAGVITRKVYDKAGRLTSVIANGATSTYTYQANGNRKDITYPNGEKEVYAYDKNNQVKQLDNKKADGSLLQSYSYTYDKAGNQLTKTENKGTTTYVYDNLGRLKSVTEPTGRKTAYTYDKGGNRKTEGVTYGSVTVLTTYTYNTQNRLVETDTIQAGESQKTAYLYDNNGNMTSKVKTTNTQKLATGANLPSFDLIIKGQAPDKDLAFYTYNKRNQMIKVVEGTTTSAYKYNADGYRTEKTVGNTSTRYLYEGDKVVAEADATNQIKARNIYGTNLLSRQVDNELLFYMYNAHGDVTALINTTGAVVATYDYDAFGTITEKTGTVNNSITYAGYQYDTESDMYYLNARYYDSKIARFMTEDTYRGQANDPLSLNLYSYVSNNPVRYYDPSGHIQTEWDKANLGQTDLAGIQAYTNTYDEYKAIYERATDPANKELAKLMMVSAHDSAEAIREKARSINQVGSSDGMTYDFTQDNQITIAVEDSASLVHGDYKAKDKLGYEEIFDKISTKVTSDIQLNDKDNYLLLRLLGTGGNQQQQQYWTNSTFLHSPGFIKVNNEDGKPMYGGDQGSWGKNSLGNNYGCGVIAATNSVFYQMLNDSKLAGKIFTDGYTPKKGGTISFNRYMELADVMWICMKPIYTILYNSEVDDNPGSDTLGEQGAYFRQSTSYNSIGIGVPTVTYFQRGMEKFAKKYGLDLTFNEFDPTIQKGTYSQATDFIANSLSSNIPVMMLTYVNKFSYDDGNKNNFHWVNITGYDPSKDSLRVSTWGQQRQVNNFKDYWSSKNVLNDVYLVSFKIK